MAAAAPTIEVRLSRPDRTYSAGETVSGVVIVNSPAPVAHNGLVVRVSGVVYPTLDPRTTGLLEALYSSLKPIEILSNTVELFGPGKLPGGVGFPFEFPVEALPGKSLTETYHGVYVTVKYTVTAELNRGRMQPPLENRVELIVEVPASKDVQDPAPVSFEIKPQSLSNLKQEFVSKISDFSITGHLNQTNCSLSSPFTGEITVNHCGAKIKSLELQLVRVETITYAEGTAREPTEIQNLQIGLGDVCRKLPIPLYMIFPRVFTCPTTISEGFRVEFEVNVIASFEEGYLVSENLPIRLFRERRSVA